MEQFIDFMDEYFVFIFFGFVIVIVAIFFIGGKAAVKMFDDVDLTKVIYSEKFASGYSTKSFLTKLGGAQNSLHVIITDQQLILKCNFLLAFVANKFDLLHRIPLKNLVGTELKNGAFNSKLQVRFNTSDGQERVVVLMSKRNIEIKEVLDKYLV